VVLSSDPDDPDRGRRRGGTRPRPPPRLGRQGRRPENAPGGPAGVVPRPAVPHPGRRRGRVPRPAAHGRVVPPPVAPRAAEEGAGRGAADEPGGRPVARPGEARTRRADPGVEGDEGASRPRDLALVPRRATDEVPLPAEPRHTGAGRERPVAGRAGGSRARRRRVRGRRVVRRGDRAAARASPRSHPPGVDGERLVRPGRVAGTARRVGLPDVRAQVHGEGRRRGRGGRPRRRGRRGGGTEFRGGAARHRNSAVGL
ncbi:hypothetical protein THAOC_17189, partial [Thalassiosira oceanica]